MRISDWISDVCSSDLNLTVVDVDHDAVRNRVVRARQCAQVAHGDVGMPQARRQQGAAAIKAQSLWRQVRQGLAKVDLFHLQPARCEVPITPTAAAATARYGP